MKEQKCVYTSEVYVTALNQLLSFFQVIPAYVMATSTRSGRQLTAISPSNPKGLGARMTTDMDTP